MRFRAPGKLARHQTKHTGAKNFECRFEGCNKRFTQHEGRRAHEKTCVARCLGLRVFNVLAYLFEYILPPGTTPFVMSL